MNQNLSVATNIIFRYLFQSVFIYYLLSNSITGFTGIIVGLLLLIASFRLIYTYRKIEQDAVVFYRNKDNYPVEMIEKEPFHAKYIKLNGLRSPVYIRRKFFLHSLISLNENLAVIMIENEKEYSIIRRSYSYL